LETRSDFIKLTM